MLSKIKGLKTNKPTKIGLLISLYFLLILVLQSFTYRNLYVDFFSPYPQSSGHITGDIAAFGIGLVYLILGIVGIIVFYISKINTPFILQMFLFLTSFNGLLSLTNIHSADRNKIIFYTADILWGIIGVIGIVLLQIKILNREK